MKLKYWVYSLFLPGALILSGCFPERQPFKPEDLETRRPKVAFIVPDDEAVVSPSTEISVWFDELMHLETVKSGFSLTLAVERLPWRQIQKIGCVARNPLNSAELILGRSDGGGFTSQNSGDSWQFHYPLAYSKVLNFYFDPQQSGRIFARMDSALLKTENSGASWAAVTDGLPVNMQISCLAINPKNSAEVWLGTEQGLFRSDNAGESWQVAGSLPQWSGHTISQIAFAPADNSTLLVTTLGRYLYQSTDGGTSWEMKRGTTNRLPASRLYDVVVDDTQQIYVATINAGIYKSTDGGENWNAVNSGITNLNTRHIFLDAASRNRLIVATANQLFVTEDAGANWVAMPLPNSRETIIDLFLGDGNLLLATNGAVYFSEDHGNTWQKKNEIDVASLQVRGSMKFENWQGQLQFRSQEGDTLVIEPHRENDALAAYDAGLINTPPVEPNPVATKMVFTPESPLMIDWFYQIQLNGGFNASGWQPGVGVKDEQGNSMEFDRIQFFEVKTE